MRDGISTKCIKSLQSGLLPTVNPKFVSTIAGAARSIREDILVICHGGPFEEPENVQKAMDMMPGINGFYGATSIERLPVERAIKEQVAKFKALKLST